MNGTNTAASFDGSNDYILIANDPALQPSNGTIQLWFNSNDTSVTQGLLQKNENQEEGDGYRIAIVGDRVELRVQTGEESYRTITSSMTVDSSNWHHVAVTFGSGGLKLYVDGQLAGSDSTTESLSTNTAPIEIGQAGGRYFDGQIDEVALHDQVLSAAEIQSLVDAGSGGGGAGDTLDGGAGTDTASYEGSAQGIYVDLDLGTATGGDAEGDTLTNIENLTGSDHDDTLIGDAGANVLNGGDGADTLDGGAGNDRIEGGGGGDTMTGGAGSDTFVFASGGTDGDIITDFTQGQDFIDLTDFGGTDLDSISVTDDGGGNAFVYLPSGDDVTLQGVAPSAVDNSDFITFAGTSGNDTLSGSAVADGIHGGAGDDTINAGDGDDVIYGGAGSDIAYGEAGDDIYVFAEGDLGNDAFYGGAGWADEIEVTSADGTNGPVDGPWTVEIDGGSTTVVTDAAGVLNLTADSSGTITLADGSELIFEGVDRITW